MGTREEDKMPEDDRFGTIGMDDDDNLEDGEQEEPSMAKTEAEKFDEKMQKRGVIYISRIPPYMQPLKIRNYFSQFGRIDRVYLTPEDPRHRAKRKKHRGNPRKKFVDGWVEFCSKKIAKRVTESLNGQTMGGDKRNYWRDDVWNIKYLPKFKWYHLAETITYANAIKTEKMKAGSNLAKRENEDYLKKVQKGKGQEETRRKKRARNEEEGVVPKADEGRVQFFPQRGKIESKEIDQGIAPTKKKKKKKASE